MSAAKKTNIFKDGWLDAEPTSGDTVRAKTLLGLYVQGLEVQMDKGTLWLGHIAEEIAVDAHKGYFDRGGEPYIHHPLWVANEVRKFVGLGGGVTVAVAALHDVVEDTDLTIDEVMAAFVRPAGHEFDAGDLAEIREGVIAITHLKGEPNRVYWARVKDNYHSRTAKRFDIKHNTLPSRVETSDEEGRARRADKYDEASEFLGFPSPAEVHGSRTKP